MTLMCYLETGQFLAQPLFPDPRYENQKRKLSAWEKNYRKIGLLKVLLKEDFTLYRREN